MLTLLPKEEAEQEQEDLTRRASVLGGDAAFASTRWVPFMQRNRLACGSEKVISPAISTESSPACISVSVNAQADQKESLYLMPNLPK